MSRCLSSSSWLSSKQKIPDHGLREVPTISSLIWLLQHLSFYILSVVRTKVGLRDLYDLKNNGTLTAFRDRLSGALRGISFFPEWLRQENREPGMQHMKCSKLSCREGRAIRETIGLQMLQNMTETQKTKFLKMPKSNKTQMTTKLLRKQTTVSTMWSARRQSISSLQ